MRLETVVVVALITVMAMTTALAQGTLPDPVQRAVADLAQRLEIEPEAVAVAGFEEVVWPDASLGHPEEGRLYAQVQTPGYRVVLHAEGRGYVYHTDRRARAVLVSSHELDVAPPDGLPEEQEMHVRLGVIAQAKQHLAEDLGIEPREVYVGAVEERTWPSTALGVEEPGRVYATVMTPGYRLVLEAQGTLYDYHADTSGQVKPAGLTQPGAPAPDQVEHTPAVDAAVADLAERLNIDQDRVAVLDVERLDWPSGALGLPEPGMMYTQALVPGYRITLQAKDRTFAYHADLGATARYAGIVHPDDATASVVAVSPAEETDGNNFLHLQRIDPDTHERRTLVEFVSDFTVTPDGQDTIIKKRTSRSSHLLAHVGAHGASTDLVSAFDFHGMALRHDGEMLAYWMRRSVVDRDARLNILPRPGTGSAVIEPVIPGVQPGDFTTGNMAWTNDGLAFTVRTDVGARSFYWTADRGVEELGWFAVMGWVPRTNALLIRRAQDNREILATFIPGTGESAVLADVPSMQSVDAPAGEQWVVAAIGEGGAPQLQQITWGGTVTLRADLHTPGRASVRVSPLGDMAVAEYMRDDAIRIGLIALEEPAEVRELEDAAGAVVVVD